jgi:2-dehydropantoate 2-reductase
MRVLVVGAGIIGSIYGWALAEGGHQVVHLVRAGRAATFCNGMTLNVFDRRKGHKRNFRGLYRLNAVETLSPADTFELVIVPVKHYALLQTLKEIVPRPDAAEFLLLTQNWRGTEEIDSILPRPRYIYGDAKAGGKFSEGILIAAVKAIDIGAPEGEPTALVKRAAELFVSADIPTRIHSNMLHYLWVQYAMTAGLWAALVQAGSFDAMRNNTAATSMAMMAGCECLQVARRRGVNLSRYPETSPFLTNSVLRRRFYGWAMRRIFRHAEYTKRCSAHALGDPLRSGRSMTISLPWGVVSAFRCP